MSDSVRPHRQKPTRFPRPWDSPGKNTGVGCHFLLQCMKVKSESEFAQSCPTLRDPMDCSLPGSSIHGILQARVLEWGADGLLRPWNFPGKRTGVGAIAFSGHKLVLSKDDHKGHYPFLSLTPFAPSLWGRGGHTHQSPLGSTKTYPKNGGHCF